MKTTGMNRGGRFDGSAGFECSGIFKLSFPLSVRQRGSRCPPSHPTFIVRLEFHDLHRARAASLPPYLTSFPVKLGMLHRMEKMLEYRNTNIFVSFTERHRWALKTTYPKGREILGPVWAMTEAPHALRQHQAAPLE